MRLPENMYGKQLLKNQKIKCSLLHKRSKRKGYIPRNKRAINKDDANRRMKFLVKCDMVWYVPSSTWKYDFLFYYF